jgi:hypothetical protein
LLVPPQRIAGEDRELEFDDGKIDGNEERQPRAGEHPQWAPPDEQNRQQRN